MYCKHCQKVSGFYDSLKLKSRCKDCWGIYWHKIAISESRKSYKKIYNSIPENKLKKNQRNREYYKNWYKKKKLEGNFSRPDFYKDYIYKYAKGHRESVKAQAKTRYAVKKGLIIKPTICSFCKESKKIHAHHEDYNKFLDVIWLCASCHKRHHTYHSLF